MDIYKRQQQTYHESCSCYGACAENSCVMSRLSPNPDPTLVSLNQECLTPCVMHEPPVGTVFHPGGVSMGLDNGLLQTYGRVLHSPCLQLDGLRYNSTGSCRDPHSPVCMVPLPEHIGEPSFIRRRNERERERVRCVNDGYDKLKDHLPLADKDRRLSKVETLRGAIKYIRQLKRLLEHSEEDSKNRGAGRTKRACLTSRKRRSSVSSSEEAESSQSDS